MKILLQSIFFLLLFCYILDAQDDASVCYQLFNSPRTFTELVESSISGAAEAVWTASGLNGNNVTISGTIIQSASGSWSYSADPSDRLIVKLFNGAQAEFAFKSINGWIQGTADDFTKSHQLDFTAKLVNSFELHVISNTYPDDAKKIHWTRHSTGTLIYYGISTVIDLTHSGTSNTSVDVGWAESAFEEQITGTVTSDLYTASLDHYYWSHMMHNSNAGQFVMNREIKSSSSATSGGTNYAFQNARVRWASGTQWADSARAGIYNEMIDADYWIAEGAIYKNNQHFGNILFESPVSLPSYGPILIVNTNNGRHLLIHNLLRYWIGVTTDVNDNELLADGFMLKQNYPNPFNPETNIEYYLPLRSRVILEIYNSLGQLVTCLVNQEETAGIKKIFWDAGYLSSGIYIVKMTAESLEGKSKFISAKKLSLLK